jgi:8-amino-7-oxononanoate synthase
MNDVLLDGLPGRTARVQGREYLFFSGYAYLGVQHVPAFKALVKEGIDKYGWLHPSSRISNTQIDLFAACEEKLSAITGCESTVLVSNGYTAGRMAVEQWPAGITNLQPSHPAIRTPNPPQPTGVYAVDAVDVLASNVTNINQISNIPGLSALIIDDSHGMGLTGTDGRGAGSYTNKQAGTSYMFTYSLSKALGINAGAISCTRQQAAALRAMPVYTASTPPSPALLYAFLKGQDIYQQQLALLKQNIQYLRQLLSGLPGISNHPDLPVFVLPANTDEALLFNRNIIISSFAYPDPQGQRIRRIVVNALHTNNDLEYLAGCVREGVGEG